MGTILYSSHSHSQMKSIPHHLSEEMWFTPSWVESTGKLRFYFGSGYSYFCHCCCKCRKPQPWGAVASCSFWQELKVVAKHSWCGWSNRGAVGSHLWWQVWFLQRRHLSSWAHTTLVALLVMAGFWKWGYGGTQEHWGRELGVVAKNIHSAGITMATVLPGWETFTIISLNSWALLSTYVALGSKSICSDPKHIF